MLSDSYNDTREEKESKPKFCPIKGPVVIEDSSDDEHDDLINKKEYKALGCKNTIRDSIGSIQAPGIFSNSSPVQQEKYADMTLNDIDNLMVGKVNLMTKRITGGIAPRPRPTMGNLKMFGSSTKSTEAI